MSGKGPAWLQYVQQYESGGVRAEVSKLEAAAGGRLEKITDPRLIGMALRVIADAADSDAVLGQ